jgi:hypothetical protein
MINVLTIKITREGRPLQNYTHKKQLQNTTGFISIIELFFEIKFFGANFGPIPVNRGE